MSRKSLTDDYKYKYIADNAEVFCERNKKNADKLNGYENLKGEELDKVYKIVQGSIRRSNKKANKSEIKADNGVVIVTPKSILENTIKDLLKKNLTYVEWEDIKGVANKLVQDIEGKLKALAKDELDKKIKEREDLNKIIAALEEQAK